MRSVDSPRVLHDATVELDSGKLGRAVNLSTSGILVSSEEKLDPGAQVRLKVNLRDGAKPLDVGAEVVRAGSDGLALRFVDLDDVARQRLQRLIQKREPTGVGKHDVRIHLPSLTSPLRASARELNDSGVMIEADLPWLRLGSPVTAELSPERACDGHVSWIGLDVTRVGAARLRIFVDFSGDENSLAPPPPDLIAPKKGRAGNDPSLLTPALQRRHLVWPAIAITALIAVGALTVALTLRPPKPTLLPTAPPEREELAIKIPPRTIVPKESDPEFVGPLLTSGAVASTATAGETTPSASPSNAPTANAAPASAPTASEAATQSRAAKAAHKKRHQAKRRAG